MVAGGSGIICYSSFRQAFVRYPVPGQKGVLPMHAELFTAPAELRALCTLNVSYCRPYLEMTIQVRLLVHKGCG